MIILKRGRIYYETRMIKHFSLIKRIMTCITRMDLVGAGVQY